MINTDVIDVVFFGTPDVSCYALRTLLDDKRFDVKAVVTQPPRPIGRHRVVTKSAVHELASENNIEVLTPVRAHDVSERLLEIGAELHVVVAFGQILPEDMVEAPVYGTLNIHPSLLPRWRGASPVPATILSGDNEAGVCIMVMDKEMDHGPILDVSRTTVGMKDTPELLDELMRIGAEHLPDVAYKWVHDRISVVLQDHDKATFSRIVSKDDGRIDWNESKSFIERMIRAYRPWPLTWAIVDINGEKRVKVLEAHLDESFEENNVFSVDDGVLHVGTLVIDSLQIEGKKDMRGADFASTHKGFSSVLN